ncbi:MAG: hypothetical protein CSA26_12410 [Desulfobacterales bacterium]|nr:MAG: hypothetical protein CSA26_12410 [Desulfobacterales bacterium]
MHKLIMVQLDPAGKSEFIRRISHFLFQDFTGVLYLFHMMIYRLSLGDFPCQIFQLSYLQGYQFQGLGFQKKGILRRGHKGIKSLVPAEFLGNIHVPGVFGSSFFPGIAVNHFQHFHKFCTAFLGQVFKHGRSHADSKDRYWSVGLCSCTNRGLVSRKLDIGHSISQWHPWCMTKYLTDTGKDGGKAYQGHFLL